MAASYTAMRLDRRARPHTHGLSPSSQAACPQPRKWAGRRAQHPAPGRPCVTGAGRPRGPMVAGGAAADPGPGSPHVAGLGLVHHQQVAVHLVHQLWGDPAQRHPQLVGGHEVVLLRHVGRRHPPGPRPPALPLRPAQPTHSVFAVRQAVVTDLHRQVGREQAVPQGQVTGGGRGRSASGAQLEAPGAPGRPDHSSRGSAQWADRKGHWRSRPPPPAQSSSPSPSTGLLGGPTWTGSQTAQRRRGK